MNGLLAALCALAPAVACAAGAADAIPFGAALGARQMHEECQRIEAGQKRAYSWKADAAVDFNIHYHHEPKVFYPVKRAATRGERGTFTARTGEDYCWMWTARDRPAKLEGAIEK
jgi:hypothetical protein